MTQVTRETITIIALLAPHPEPFREIQLAHREFRLDAAHQYLIRSRFRRLSTYRNDLSQTYSQVLPGYNQDGFITVIYTHGEYTRKYCFRNKYYGTYVRYDASNVLRERREYRVAREYQYPTSTWYYDAHGVMMLTV